MYEFYLGVIFDIVFVLNVFVVKKLGKFSLLRREFFLE